MKLLIKKSLLQKSLSNNGFVVESFVRENVNIQIEFKEPIELHSIVLNSKVNSQISTGFIISSSIYKNNYNSPASSNSFKQLDIIINDSNKSCFIYEFNRRNAIINNDQIVNRAYFSVSNQSYLNKVTSINIRIVKTLNSTNCCLKSVKINGYLPNSAQQTNETTKQISSNKNIAIPDEFIDSITQEMIRVPIILPSSKVVDKSTLDRYVEEQNRNKEAIKDPFTNLPIDSSKIAIDEKLKSKIDHFILDSRLMPFNKSSNTKEKDNTKHVNKKRKIDEVEICNCCLNQKSSDKHLYKIINCQHLFCKECLMNLNKMCIVCKIKFDNSQVIKVY